MLLDSYVGTYVAVQTTYCITNIQPTLLLIFPIVPNVYKYTLHSILVLSKPLSNKNWMHSPSFAHKGARSILLINLSIQNHRFYKNAKHPRLVRYPPENEICKAQESNIIFRSNNKFNSRPTNNKGIWTDFPNYPTNNCFADRCCADVQGILANVGNISSTFIICWVLCKIPYLLLTSDYACTLQFLWTWKIFLGHGSESFPRNLQALP